jgi:hypothetical protein
MRTIGTEISGLKNINKYRSRGKETSDYSGEKKSKEISLVMASERDSLGINNR